MITASHIKVPKTVMGLQLTSMWLKRVQKRLMGVHVYPRNLSTWNAHVAPMHKMPKCRFHKNWKLNRAGMAGRSAPHHFVHHLWKLIIGTWTTIVCFNKSAILWMDLQTDVKRCSVSFRYVRWNSCKDRTWIRFDSFQHARIYQQLMTFSMVIYVLIIWKQWLQSSRKSENTLPWSCCNVLVALDHYAAVGYWVLLHVYKFLNVLG